MTASDQPAPGWWLASDGYWYPPEQSPGWPAPPGSSTPPTDPKRRRVWPWVVGGVVALLLLIGIVAPKDDEVRLTNAEGSTSTTAELQPTTTPTTAPPTTAPPTTAPPTTAPTTTAPPPAPPPTAPPPPPTAPPTTAAAQTAPAPLSSSVYYANCSAARAAGAAPLHVGDPGYASHLDRDHDGIACE